MLLGDREEAAITGEVVRYMHTPALDLTGKTDFGQLAAVLSRCSLLISNDSGVMHVGAAVGTHVVAIFGPSNPKAWGPWDGIEGKRTRVVRVELPCSPCLYVGHSVGRRYGCPGMTCLEAITPPMVLAAAEQLLSSALSHTTGR